MRLELFSILALLLTGGEVLADRDLPDTYYVRYAINMDFLPPLIGERQCQRARPCDIVSLEHFKVVLTAPYDHDVGSAVSGALAVHCLHRPCAIKDGRGFMRFSKEKRNMRFLVTDREYPADGLLVCAIPAGKSARSCFPTDVRKPRARPLCHDEAGMKPGLPP